MLWAGGFPTARNAPKPATEPVPTPAQEPLPKSATGAGAFRLPRGPTAAKGRRPASQGLPPPPPRAVGEGRCPVRWRSALPCPYGIIG